MQQHDFFVPASRGIPVLLAEELQALGASDVEASRSGVGFRGSLAVGYRACLWSRLASRVLLVLARVPAATADALYEAVRQLPWSEHMEASGKLAVRFNGSSDQIRNSHFGALRVKDAVVDTFRESSGRRPSVDREQPDLRIDAHLYGGRAVISIDLSGQALHRRGYRVSPVTAPLRENLAAAVLAQAQWPTVAARGGPLVDPMCGSGTLLIEAAWMATDRAPQLERGDLGLLRWRGHDAYLWKQLIEEARDRAAAAAELLPTLCGYDADASAVKAARANLKRAGLAGRVTVERRSLGEEHGPPPGPGLLVTNPPYGQRLSEENAVRALYVELAEEMRVRYGGWEAAVLCATTAPRDDSASTGSRAVQAWASILGLGASTALRNGPLDCHLLRGALAAASPSVAEPGSAGADMFGNRLRKNRKSLGRWARKNGITCYRLYDADMPEYAVAVDLYEAQQLWVHVQEYRAPASVDPQRAAQRLQEALRTIAQVLEIPRSQLHLKVREKQRGSSQYERLGAQGVYHEVREADQTLFVNFTDYLDTGLFLDHRPTRALIRELAAGRDFLNLFAYTGTASVHAAAGGATSTTSVDLSRPYLDWARRNLERNGFHRPVHDVVQADCLDWLQRTHRRRWGLIFVDPPTFSNSKRMDRTFDVQRDHADLIGAAAQLLTDDGVLLFSTNFRRFELDETALSRFHCQDISRQTLPRDFERSPRVHRCYRIESAPQ